MPAKSEKQRRFMGAELARKRAGHKTKTGMSEAQLRDYAKGERVAKKKPAKKKSSKKLPPWITEQPQASKKRSKSKKKKGGK